MLLLSDLGSVALYQVLYVLLGLAFGMLLMSPSLAIVLYFVLPIARSILGSLISALRTRRVGWTCR